MDPKDLLDVYCKQGFAKIERLLDPALVDTMRRECEALVAGSSSAADHISFLGLSATLDTAFEALIQRDPVRTFLERSLGSGYRLHSAALRMARPGAERIRMHQDQPGETKLSILLSDALAKDGSTVFVPGSHAWPRMLNCLPFTPDLVDRHTRGTIGRAGDAYVFTGRIWHGRPFNEATTNLVLLISFIPRGTPYEVRLPAPGSKPHFGAYLNRILAEQPVAPTDVGPAAPALEDMLTYRTRLPGFSPWHFARLFAACVEKPIQAMRHWRGHRPLSPAVRAYDDRLRRVAYRRDAVR